MSVDVRRALPADAGCLLPLIREHAAFERGEATVTAATLGAALAGDSPALRAWLADTAGTPVGYAAATMDFSTWVGRPYLHLDCLFVAATHRGAGIGARLLAVTRAYARSEGVPELQWQPPSWNEDAIRFYLRQGATAASKQRFSMPT
jgi:GNAT superfamily N-acetyltransferase